MEINDRFLDYDFTKDENYVRGYLGYREDGAYRDFADVEGVLTDSEIDECIAILDANPEAGLDYLVTRVFNQRQEGSCVGNAVTQDDEVLQAKQFGKENVIPLSAISVYKRIGSSPGSGAMVSDALDEICKRGALPLDTPANREKFGDAVMPHTGFYTKFPADWEKTAKQFAGREYLVIKGVNALLSALCKGFPVVVGREGHSILYLRPMRRNGKRVVKYVNSWGEWGDAGGTFPSGFGYDSESQIRKSAGWAFALRTIAVPTWRQSA